jgi:hypothetical protein
LVIPDGGTSYAAAAPFAGSKASKNPKRRRAGTGAASHAGISGLRSKLAARSQGLDELRDEIAQ